MKRFDYDEERFIDNCESEDNYHSIQEERLIPKCNKCDLQFDSMGDLERHEVVNHPDQLMLIFEPEFRCSYCGEVFNFELSLDLHLEKVHNQPLK